MELDDCILIEEDKDCFIVNPNENIKSNSELAEVKNSQGSTFYSKGLYLNARNSYSEAVQLEPNNAIYYANRAAANMALNDLQTVQEDLNKAISLDPAYLKAYTRKFNYLISIGELVKAEQMIDKIKTFDSDNKQVDQLISKTSNIKYNQSCYDKAISKNDFRQALFYIENILSICSSSINFKLKKAEMLAYLLRHEEVINIVDAIIRKDNTNSEAYFIRGLSLFFQDNIDKAIAHFQQALKTNPEHTKSINFYRKAKRIKQLKEQGKEAFSNNKLDDAIKFYKDALETDPNYKIGNAKLHFNLSVVYGKQKKTKEALAECSNAIKLDETYDKAYMKRANLYDELEMYEESVKDYEHLYKKLKTKETKQFLETAKLQLVKSKRKNYYKILGISKGATDKEIKAAYRKCALETHPDKNTNIDQQERLKREEKFKEIGEAFNCLSDPVKRHRYDNGLDQEGVGPLNESFNNYRMFCEDDIINNIFFNFRR